MSAIAYLRSLTHRTQQGKNASGPSPRATTAAHKESYLVSHPRGRLHWSSNEPLTPVYDVSSRSTFDELIKWFREIETYCAEDVVKILVGNKVDKVGLRRNAADI